MMCKLCSAVAVPFARARVLAKYDVDYYQCQDCGFVQTEEPYWLDEAYSQAITDSDLGLVSRNLSLATITRAAITMFFKSDAQFVDYGGGYGLFVRLMRDHGFDFYRYDKFCANLFAPGFDIDPQGGKRYELLTAFEVFEHLASPLDEIAHMLGLSNSILFSTMVIPARNPHPDEWWYYGLEHGQHVALYTRKSLELFAAKLHLNLYSNGLSLHLLTSRKISSLAFNIVTRGRVAEALRTFSGGRSRLADDYYQITGRHLG